VTIVNSVIGRYITSKTDQKRHQNEHKSPKTAEKSQKNTSDNHAILPILTLCTSPHRALELLICRFGVRFGRLFWEFTGCSNIRNHALTDVVLLTCGSNKHSRWIQGEIRLQIIVRVGCRARGRRLGRGLSGLIPF